MTKPDRNWIAHARLVGADFEEKTLEFRYEGDLMPLAKGRYAIVPADAMHTMLLRLKYGGQEK